MPRSNNLRAIRVEGPLWDAAKRAAEHNGEPLARVIVRALEEYVGSANLPEPETYCLHCARRQSYGWDRCNLHQSAR